MSLNKPWFFFLVAVVTSLTYYFQHIRLAEFVFEDPNWIITDFYKWSWHDLYAIPGNRLTLVTFIHNTPIIAHSINLLIHVINALLLSILIESWFGSGWIVGSLFLVNPLASQAVAYASGRGELLATGFLFGFLWFSTCSKLSSDKRWILFQVCLLGIATTKATILAVTVPLLIWVYISDAEIENLEGLKYLIVLFLLSIPILIYEYLNVIKSNITIYRWFAIQSYASIKLFYEAATGRGLAIDHSWFLISTSLQVLAALGIITLLFIAIKMRKSLIFFGIGWYIISFLPRLLAHVNLGWIREHHAYASLPGFCIFLFSLLSWATLIIASLLRNTLSTHNSVSIEW